LSKNYRNDAETVPVLLRNFFQQSNKLFYITVASSQASSTAIAGTLPALQAQIQIVKLEHLLTDKARLLGDVH
jgi:hypothetical protein